MDKTRYAGQPELVEIVAKALASDMEEGFPRFTQQRWDQLSAPAKAAFLQRSRVAIEALKTGLTIEGSVPGGVAIEDAMFGECKLVFEAARDCFVAICDAALSEDKP